MVEDLYRKYLEVTADPQAAALLVLAHMMQGKPQFLTVKQAAKELGVSPNLVYAMCEAGELRCTRVGRLIRILPEDLQQIMKSKPKRLSAARIAELEKCFQ